MNKKQFVIMCATVCVSILAGAVIIGLLLRPSNVSASIGERTVYVFGCCDNSCDQKVNQIYTSDHNYEKATPTPKKTEEENDRDEKTPTPTTTPTETPTYTPTEEPTETPTPTFTPKPTEEPEQKVDHTGCNNGLGNDPDCPPPGHDKNGDGLPDDPKGSNDRDETGMKCGDKGEPCNNPHNNPELEYILKKD